MPVSRKTMTQILPDRFDKYLRGYPIRCILRSVVVDKDGWAHSGVCGLSHGGGDRCLISASEHTQVEAEVVGFSKIRYSLAPSQIEGLRPGIKLPRLPVPLRFPLASRCLVVF